MMNLAFLNIGTQEMIFIVIIILFLFGGKKLPELARGLGRGIREFKDASDGIKREISEQINNFEKDLDVEEDVKSAQSTPSSKVNNLSEEIKEHHDGAVEEQSTASKTPVFSPPPGTYQHNPYVTPGPEDYEHYSHPESQNNVAYTPGPDDVEEPTDSSPSPEDEEQPQQNS